MLQTQFSESYSLSMLVLERGQKKLTTTLHVHSACSPMSGTATSPPSAAADDAKEEAAASLTKAEKSVRELSPCGRYERTDEELGSGSYKKVWKAYDTEEGYMVAWNTVRIGGFSNVDKKRILNEIKTLRILTEKEETKRFIVNLHHSCKPLHV